MAGRRPVDVLAHVVNEVVVTTAKGFRAARPDGNGNLAAAATVVEARVPAAVEKFNAILDEIECDIFLSKAVLERDLSQLRAKRQPPPPEQKPVAPPAPMAVDLESPKLTAKEPITGPPGSSLPGNQANKPVAPFPNMGFDSTSPKVTPAPAPGPNGKAAPKPKDVKNLARPAVTPAATGRPASAPPKKDVKVPAGASRPGGVATAPQTPLNHAVQVKGSAAAAANKQAPTPTLSNTPGVASAALSTPASNGSENLFTDMTFSLAPPPGETQILKPAPQQPRRASQQQQPVPIGTTNIANQGATEAPSLNMEQFTAGPADVANMGVEAQPGKVGEASNITDVDDKIDGLFDLGPGDMDNMDLGFDLGNGDNSNFNDMYFPAGDSNGGTGDFDDAFFNLDG